MDTLKLCQALDLLRDTKARQKGFDLMRALRVSRNEVSHSRVLAALLDPRFHRSAHVILRRLLLEWSRKDELPSLMRERLVAMLDEEVLTQATVSLERFFIDVVVHVRSPQGDLVVGIENKIDAGEQHKQLARYQNTLLSRFPGEHSRLMIFLTPDGRSPTTALGVHQVPCLAFGYQELAQILRALLYDRESIDEADRPGIEAFVGHIEEELVNSEENPEIQELVREIWRDHADVLRLLLRHRPRLDDVQEEYVRRVREALGEDAKFRFYPLKKRPLLAIMVTLESWCEKGLPLTFMLDGKPGGEAQIRVLVDRGSFKEHGENMKRWAEIVNVGDNNALLDANFKQLRGWSHWHRVLDEEDYPPGAFFGDGVYDSCFVEEAVDRLLGLVGVLRPWVDC